MKNPRQVAFVRQANIANGAQQVNNGIAKEVRARTRKSRNLPIKQLEQRHGQWMDTGETSEASCADPDVAAVGAVDRPDKRER
jgi:hypothetical protein